MFTVDNVFNARVWKVLKDNLYTYRTTSDADPTDTLYVRISQDSKESVRKAFVVNEYTVSPLREKII